MKIVPALFRRRRKKPRTSGAPDMLAKLPELETRTVHEVMVHRKQMFTVSMEMAPQELIRQVAGTQHTRIPVWQGTPDNIIGILHAKDVLRALAQEGGMSLPALLTLVRKPWFIPSTTSLKDQLIAFRRHRSHIAMVVDEYGSLEGLVTLEDILEEIVGEIGDEHDKLFSGIIPQLDGTVLLEGDTSLRDINHELGWQLPEDHAATIAGLVIHEARYIPDTGAMVTLYDTQFEVIEKQENRIIRLRAERLAELTD